LIIQFLDAAGKPVVDATVCVANAPVSFPDIGMMTDDLGQVQLAVTQPGLYGFSVFSNGKPTSIEARLDPSQKQISLHLKSS
jgi:hypothetical protein